MTGEFLVFATSDNTVDDSVTIVRLTVIRPGPRRSPILHVAGIAQRLEQLKVKLNEMGRSWSIDPTPEHPEGRKGTWSEGAF